MDVRFNLICERKSLRKKSGCGTAPNYLRPLTTQPIQQKAPNVPQVTSHERGIWLKAVLKYLIMRETVRSDATMALVAVRPGSKDGRLWKRLRYRDAPIKQHVLGDLPESAAPLLAERSGNPSNGTVLPLESCRC